MYSEIVDERYKLITNLLMSGHTANFLDNILAKLDGKLPIDLIDAAYLLNNADNIYIQKIVLSASMKYRRYSCRYFTRTHRV